jgi:phage tail sheath protein FI
MSLGTDGAAESAVTVSSLATAYDLYKSKEDVDISLVMQGKAVGTGGLANYIIANIIEPRKDCMLFISPDASIITNNDPAQYAVNFRGAAGGVSGVTYNSSYVVMDTGYKYQYDKYNDIYRWVPLNADVAGVCATTDQQRDAWWSPAGFNRGQIKNVVKLLFNPNQAQRDLLYKNDVNPVVTFPGQGTVLYGDKTMLGKPSAFDRINVRRLFIVLEKAIARAAQSSLFEFNDEFTRAQFRSLVEPFLAQVQGRRGIFDYKVVCDETNNTPQVIDSNQFVGDIYIKPARSINFIQLNFVAVRTGVDFNTIVGQF